VVENGLPEIIKDARANRRGRALYPQALSYPHASTHAIPPQ
jgi:hypothetical protein